ncbi:hypothetical protein FOI42_RS03595 [Escherichia coli]|nr:hypothetical protein [Escherichia coli]
MNLQRDVWTYEYLLELYGDMYLKNKPYIDDIRAMIDDFSSEFIPLYTNKEVTHKSMNKSGIIDEIDFDTHGVYFYIIFSNDTVGIYTYKELK